MGGIFCKGQKHPGCTVYEQVAVVRLHKGLAFWSRMLMILHNDIWVLYKPCSNKPGLSNKISSHIIASTIRTSFTVQFSQGFFFWSYKDDKRYTANMFALDSYIRGDLRWRLWGQWPTNWSEGSIWAKKNLGTICQAPVASDPPSAITSDVEIWGKYVGSEMVW